MLIEKTKVFSCIGMLLCLSQGAAAEPQKAEQTVESYSVELGATRVIYNPVKNGAVVSVSNPNAYPVLVQSTVVGENKTDKAPFVITPPLFRLESKQQSRLRLTMTGDGAAKDRETLYWMCATGIPPEMGDAWAGDESKSNASASLNVKVKLSQCIKVLVRPESIKGKPDDVASSITWQRKGDTLVGNNPTPFYFNLKSLQIGSESVPLPEYIAPFSTRSYNMPKGASGKITWEYINDYGGISRLQEATTR